MCLNEDKRFVYNFNDYYFYRCRVNINSYSFDTLVKSAITLAKGCYTRRKINGYNNFIYCIDYFNANKNIINEVLHQINSISFLNATQETKEGNVFIKIYW